MKLILDFLHKSRQARVKRNKDFQLCYPLGDISFGRVFNGLSCIIIARCILEALLEEHVLGPHQADYYETIIAYAHVYISWLCLFSAFSMLVAEFTRTSLNDSFKLVVLGSPLILIVPFADYIIHGGGRIIYGENFSDFIYNYVNLFNPRAPVQMVTTGVRIEVFLATAGTFLISRFYLGTGLMRSALLALSLYTTIFLFGYLPAIMPNPSPNSDLPYLQMYLPVFIILAVLVALRLHAENHKWGSIISHLLFPSRLFFYFLLLAFGMVFSAKETDAYPQIFFHGGIMNFLLASVSISLLFMYAKIQNDFYDRNIDSVSNPRRPVIFSAMAPENVLMLKNVFLVPSFLFGLAANRYFPLFWALILVLSALYSELPLRLRRFYPVGHFILSLIGASVFMSGAVLVGSRDFFEINGVPQLALCVFAGFFSLSHIKDYKDMDGDRHGGVANVFNLTSSPRAVGICAVSGFAITLIFALQLLSICKPTGILVILIYLIIAVMVIVRTVDLRRLDWVLWLSFVPFVCISLIWLLAA